MADSGIAVGAQFKMAANGINQAMISGNTTEFYRRIRLGEVPSSEAFISAVKSGHCECVRICLRHLDPHLHNSVLVEALKSQQCDMAKLLLQSGCDICVSQVSDAVLSGMFPCLDCVRLLREYDVPIHVHPKFRKFASSGYFQGL